VPHPAFARWEDACDALSRSHSSSFDQRRRPETLRTACDGLLLADKDHQPLAASNAGVEEVSLQHGIMLGQDRDDHGWILRTLALVDGGGIGGN
jgi:hypothetical protein